MQLHFLQIHPTQSIYLLSHKLSMGGNPTVISSTTHAVHNVSAVNKGYKEATGRSSAERCVGNAGSIATGQAQGAGMWSDAAWSAFNPYNGGYHQAVGMISLAGLIIGEAARFRRPPRQENVAVPLSCTGHENRIVGDGIWHGTQNAASPPGTSGVNGRGGGGHGTDGSDGSPGCDGADIHCTLRSEGQTVSFTATLSGQHPHAGKVFSNAEDARAFGSIMLQSHGGHGGPGGHGGHGAAGVTGYAGRGATRESPGTDGGPGGLGGNAGSGGNGGNAGTGGQIVVEVASEHAFLLMVVEGLDEPVGWAQGGHGGKRGLNGKPGAGGSGGPGGKPCHWTTQRQEWQTEHYTDEEGKKQSRQVQKTVTDHHHQPGGRNGPRGPSGMAAAGSPQDGAAGADTSVAISIDWRTYGQRYALTVTHFDVAAMGAPATPSAKADEIFEFGEVCHAQRITLNNKSGTLNGGRAPSPARQRVRVHILENEWVARSTLTVDAFCAQSIEAGSTAPCDGFASFEIKYDPRNDFRAAWPMDRFAAHDLGPNALADFDPIVQRVEVVAVASQLGFEDAAGSGSHTRFQREYLDSHHGYAIPEVQFPVRNSDGRQPARCGAAGTLWPPPRGPCGLPLEAHSASRFSRQD
jgi:hypothetical protein